MCPDGECGLGRNPFPFSDDFRWHLRLRVGSGYTRQLPLMAGCVVLRIDRVGACVQDISIQTEEAEHCRLTIWASPFAMNT
jgi:hypothetical protein